MVLALLLALIAVLGALVPEHGYQRAQDPLEAVNALLDERERALAAGDRSAWMATVAPGASAEFRRTQERQFDGLRSLPLDQLSFTARTVDSGDLAPGDDRFLPETRMTYRLAGYDDRDAVDSQWLTFVRSSDRWHVESDTDVADLGLDSWRNLWDLGPVALHETEHFLVVHHPAQADRARALGAIAEEAAAVLVRSWDKPWPGRLPIVLPGSVAELETLLQSTIDLDKFVAFVTYGVVRDDAWIATAPRMYIQDENLSGYGRAFQVETLVHELAHAAGSSLAGPFVPAWVHEGVADWVATGRRVNERKPAGGDAALPRDFEFTTGDRVGILRAYRESRSVVSYLAGRSGQASPTALLAAAGEPKVAPGSTDFVVDAALRRSAGIGLADLQSGWVRSSR